MSREIKFRAWDIDNNKWLNKEDEEYFLMYLDGSYEINRGWVIVIPELTIEQYTGLKDKNGKEIYEGDVVLLYGKRYIVKYLELRCSYIFSCIDIKQCYWFDITKCSECEIIGNIHEGINYD